MGHQHKTEILVWRPPPSFFSFFLGVVVYEPVLLCMQVSTGSRYNGRKHARWKKEKKTGPTDMEFGLFGQVKILPPPPVPAHKESTHLPCLMILSPEADVCSLHLVQCRSTYGILISCQYWNTRPGCCRVTAAHQTAPVCYGRCCCMNGHSALQRRPK